MTSQTSLACPRCQRPLTVGTRFCGYCGNDISGAWTQAGVDPLLTDTIAVEPEQNVDTLAALLTQATIGDYDIYGELGRGGMAAVYLALDLALNRKVAIKLMLPDLMTREGMVARFKREAQTAAGLNHPHIIQIHTVKQSAKLVYFVMKFIEGRSLESVITDTGPVPLEVTQTILTQVGSALAYAHRKGVIHRDVKPANIMLDEDGWSVVTDFGIAKVQEAQNLTATGTAIGTPHYMSPEQFHNKAVTGQSDQYSLGIVAYEMLAGCKPFDGGTYAEIVTKHLFEPPPDLREIQPGVPQHVADAVRKMMAKEPADRYSDLDAAIGAIGAPVSKNEVELVRTQMASLARGGPQKKVRMSVPVSPVPMQKRTATARIPVAPAASATPPTLPAATAPAPTVIEPDTIHREHVRPDVAPEASSPSGEFARRAGVAVAAVIVLALGFYGVEQLGVRTRTPQIAQTGTPSATRGVSSTATPDSTLRSTAATVRDTQTVAASRTPVVDSTAMTRARKDSLNRARRPADSVSATHLAKVQRPGSVAPASNSTEKASIALVKSAEVRTTAATNSAASTTATPSAVSGAPATVMLGSHTAGATLSVNGRNDGPLSGFRDVRVPSGAQVRISIAAPGCRSWDSTVTVASGSAHKVGYRNLRCP